MSKEINFPFTKTNEKLANVSKPTIDSRKKHDDRKVKKGKTCDKCIKSAQEVISGEILKAFASFLVTCVPEFLKKSEGEEFVEPRQRPPEETTLR